MKGLKWVIKSFILIPHILYKTRKYQLSELIKLKGVSKSFYTESVKTLALNDLNLSINKGEFVAVTGASGSGKSTLLSVIGLFLNIDEGEIYQAEVITNKLTNSEVVKFRRENISYIFQSFNLIPELTVEENVELPLKYRSIDKIKRRLLVKKYLDLLGLTNRAKHYPNQLSGGQQQRVAISRALVTEPRIILADEPTGNLDSENGNNVLNKLAELNKTGVTIIMATHSIEAASLASRIIKMSDGKIN